MSKVLLFAISSAVKWTVGLGENIRIREDRWLNRGVIGRPAARYEPKTV